VRLLHNIYLFLRVIEESTHIYQDNACSLVSVPAPDKKTCFPSLRTHSLHAGRDLDAHCGGDFEVGLLGENAGLEYEQSPSLFEQIYGIPRILLSFISRSTWLANQIDALRTQGQGLFFTEQLEAQCRTLEDEICGWNSHTDDLLAPGDDSVAPVNQAIMPHLVTAMHRAVIIFFYRRVRRINPLLLQSHSRDAILHLEQAEQKKLGFSVANSGIVWPGFIAAAELLDAELQARAYRLLQKCARTSGLRNFDVASSCLQDLWMTRRQRGDSTISWVDHVRERKLALILT
jgi:arginine metabolism regulation protein II